MRSRAHLAWLAALVAALLAVASHGIADAKGKGGKLPAASGGAATSARSESTHEGPSALGSLARQPSAQAVRSSLGDGAAAARASSSERPSETQGAITNLGSRTPADNAALFARLQPGEGMSGVFDHSTGNFILRQSSATNPPPPGMVAQYGGHADVRSDLGLALREDLSSAAAGRLSGFSVSRGQDGSIQFGWNSGMINPGSHGNRTVPAPLRPVIESTVRVALGEPVSRL